MLKQNSFGIKVLSLVLSVLMTISAFPLSVFAIESTDGNTEEIADNLNLVKDVVEIKELRDENVKHFRLEDGSYMAAQYEVPVHYLDENGDWQDIDNSLTESGSEISTKNAKIKFAKKITGNGTLLTIHESNHKITMSLDGAIKKTTGSIIDNNSMDGSTKLQKMLTLENLSARVLYKDILDGVDLEYIINSYDVKENIIVKKKSTNYSYTFTIKLNNLNAVLDEKGQILLSDASSGTVEYIIPTPTAYDADGVYADSSLLCYSLSDTGNGKYTLRVNVDTDWMNSDDRAYPIVIDPPISVPISSVTDLDINSTNADRSSPADPSIFVSSTWHGYWKTSSLPYIPESAYITGAQISLRSTSNYGNYIGAYQVLTDWDSTLTWNKTIADSPQGKMSSYLLDYNCVNSDNADDNKHFYWDITSLVRSWYSGTANYGVGFKPVSDTTASKASAFGSSEASDSSYYPQFTINYRDMKGIESYWAYATQDAGLAGTGSVNYATGVLTFSKSLLSTTDSLMQYTPMIVYSSAIAGKTNEYPNTQVAYWGSYMPNGFKININETIIQKKYISNNGDNISYYIWSDADGTEHYFLPTEGSTSIYKDEDGLQLTLTTDSSTCTITDSANTVRTFKKLSSTASSEVLGAWYLASITDSSKNKVVFTFETGPRPTGVSLVPNGGKQIDFLTISYNNSYLPYIIWNQASKEAIIFRYSSTPTGNITTSNTNYLREIVYAHGNTNVTAANWQNFYNNPSTTTNITVDGTAYYTYDSNGYLVNVKDGLTDYQVAYTYSNGKVISIQEYGENNTAGQKVGISYYSGYTEARTSGADDAYGTSDDIYNRFIFDAQGRTITSYSTNLSRTEIYGASTGEYESSNEMAPNSLKVSSATGSTSSNYLLNGNFETSDSDLTYWYTSGNAHLSSGTIEFGGNEAELSVSAGTTSSIYQYVYLRAGDYTLSLDVNTFESDDITIKMTAQSLTDTTRVFSKEIPHNRYYASGNSAFDFFTFTANSDEKFKIVISVIGKSPLTGEADISFDNIMLAKSDGAQAYNMVQNGDFENTSVTSNGSTRYSPGTFWEMSDDSYASAPTFYESNTATPFFKTLRLKGYVDSKQVAEQIIYSASDADLGNYSSGYGGIGMYPQVFKISGFGRASSIIHNPNAKFALRFDVTYYKKNAESETVSQYYNFCEDTLDWQYVSGSFIIPAYSMIQEIKVCCEYSGNVGYAYFDDISVILDSEGTTSQYAYDENGKTVLSITGNDVIFYSYYDSGSLYEKITHKSRTVYTYDSNNRLLTEKYYTYSGYLAYLAEYSRMIQLLGTQTLKMSSEYQYNSYGLLTQSVITSPQESESFVTKTAYNVSTNSKIFGSIATTTDSLGRSTNYIYDTKNGRLLANIQPNGIGTCYSYDAIGNLILVQPALYTGVSIPTTGSAKVVYEYNNLNQLGVVRTNGTEYSFSYNEFGAKNSVSIGDTNIISQTYNSNNGKISSVSYANGTVINYYYDSLARVEKIEYNNSGVKTIYEYEYDSNGNLSKFIDHSLNRITLYKYDDNGRMTNFLEYDSQRNENLSSAWYTYDEYSRIDMIFYDQEYVYNSENYYDSSYYLSYSYNENDTIRKYHISSDDATYTITPNYDGHNRIESKELKFHTDGYTIVGNLGYAYKSSGTKGSVVVSSFTSQIGSGSSKTYNFTYDSTNANITKVTDASGTVQNQYTYDTLGRLTREDNLEADRTYVYTYDNDGNILTKKTYGYTTDKGTPTTTLYSTYNYTYGNANWGDQLTAYRGASITYDAVGNPTSYYNGSRMYMSWRNGNNLASVTKNSVTTTYTYNDSGVRTSKTVNGVLHTYLLDGSVILSEEYDGKLFLYMYDENGSPLGIKYREDSYGVKEFDCYLFEKNFQGDITGIINEAGKQVVWYDYDAWGNRVGGAWVVHDQDIYKNLFYANPFRYRGYYQDSETGFYYCGNRYYDPAIGRFISADSTNTLMNTPMAYTDKNLYAYCDNNPVMRVDNGGEFWDTVFDVVSLCFSVVDVIKNPDDPWAWVGLAADVVSLAVPFATGGGTVVKAVSKADDVVDLVKTADRVTDTADTVYDGVKAMSKVDIPDCFVAGTPISTKFGSVPVEKIKIGDLVWSTNPETGKTELKAVVNTFVNETTHVTHITVNGETITSTQTHPYYVADRGWILAGNLRAGDILVTLNGEYVVLEQVQHEILEAPVATYNFEVEGFHTYYVGENDILVHNKCFRGRLQDLTQMTDEAIDGMDAHHVFPQKFSAEFTEIGLDFNNEQFGSWVKDSIHRGFSYEYNVDWNSFLHPVNNKLPSYAETIEFGKMMAKKYGFDILF